MSKLLPLRPNVCLLIYNQELALFVGERKGSPGIWQLPQGGIGKNNTVEEAALRETHEELGVPMELIEVKATLRASHEYNFDKPPSYAVGKWRGQKQNFCVIYFSGKNKDINLEFHDPEFSDFKWVSVNKVLEIVEPKRRAGYRAALEEFEGLMTEL